MSSLEYATKTDPEVARLRADISKLRGDMAEVHAGVRYLMAERERELQNRVTMWFHLVVFTQVTSAIALAVAIAWLT